MTYIYRVLKNGPIGLWPMDSNFNDLSGFGKNGTVTGTPTATRPIVSGGIAAYQFDDTDKVTFPITSLMQQGYESKAFSLAIWYKPDSNAGTAALLARNNSGIFVTGPDVEFRLDKGSLVTAKYSGVETGNRYFIVAVYDGEAGYIYVNGDVVATIPVNSGTFADIATSLRVEATGGAVFTTESAAVYNFALTANTVKAHYNMANDWTGVAEISAANGANVFRIWDGTTNFREILDIRDAGAWLDGGFTGSATVVGDNLTQQWDETNNRYSAGEWLYSHSINAENASLSGARISWDANIPNLAVSISLNGGLSYTAVGNGAEAFGQQSLNNGLDVLIKVGLPVGATQTVVDSLTLAIYTSKDIFGTNEDLPALVSDEPNASVAEYDYEPNSFNNNAGIKFSGAFSGLMIPQDTEFGNYRAVEMVVYLDSLPTSGSILKMGTASIDAMPDGKWDFTYISSMIVNGVSTAAPLTMVAKKPYHIIMTFPDQPGAIYIGNDSSGSAGYPMRLAYLATYNVYMGILDAQKVYGAWVGAPATRIIDANEVDISEHIYPESGLGFRGYSYTWSITGAG